MMSGSLAPTCEHWIIIYLDAVRRNNITESVVVVAEELWEVVKKDEKDSEWSSVQTVNRFGKFGIAKERR